VPVEVQYGDLMLLSACCDKKVGYRHTMATPESELPVCPHGGRDRRAVNPQLPELGEIALDPLVIGSRSRAVEQLQAHNRTQADLAKLERLRRRPL
jgi:hypothetical protein